MKKLTLTLCLIIMCTSAFAECVAIEDTVMWTDIERYDLIARIGKINPQQGLSLLLDDIRTGKAIQINKGTRVDKVVFLPDNEKVCIVRVNGMGMVGISKAIRCN